MSASPPKLSLNIDGLSGMGSSTAPSSPSYSACSMVMNKSQAELTASLKEAYNAIKEKERDLMLAVEIGKSLLENNISLKSKCEALATRLQQIQRVERKDIRELETKNMQLQSQLEDAMKESMENEKSSKAKLRKMESELHNYQEFCSSATQKIDDLEKENERLVLELETSQKC